jgi:hypothetical protein
MWHDTIDQSGMPEGCCGHDFGAPRDNLEDAGAMGELLEK